jgi:transcriptional regulator with PAS, ATPase and Fis domain
MHTHTHAISEPTLVGTSLALERLRSAAARVAAGNAKVLITGESGVGKDLIARYIHTRSSRAPRPFVALNCAGVAETLLESELFGHVKGSFTGAHRDKVGLFQLGNRGTVFLDEVGEMSLRMQAMLLRFLESGEVKPVGADLVSAKVDVRVIAATNRNLPDLVSKGQFREDLMYRIMVVHLEVPPLRSRRDDIRALVAHVIEQTGVGIEVSEEAMEVLERYHWPGNVRELQNVIEQLAWLHGPSVVGPEDLPPALTRVIGGGGVTASRERRKQVSDFLYEGLVSGAYSFWEHVYPMFINRDITRADLIALVRQALSETSGNYRAVLRLLRMEPGDYKRFLNFLSTHDCSVDFREFRSGRESRERTIQPVLSIPARAPERDRRADESEARKAV